MCLVPSKQKLIIRASMWFMTQYRPVCVHGHTGEEIRGGSEQVDQVGVLGRGMQMTGKSKSRNQTYRKAILC